MVLEDDIKLIVGDKNIKWEKLKGSKILVTGATGLIGSLCVRALQSLDIPVEIYALVRDDKKAMSMLGKDVHYIVGDVRGDMECDFCPDYVIHCAATTASQKMIENPVDTLDIAINGTYNVLKLAQSSNVDSVVYISSMEAYGITEEDQNPVTEDKLGFIDLTSARSSYSEGKRAAECLCMAFFHQYKLPIKIARLALTMGPGIPKTDNRVSMQFAMSAVEGRDIILRTEGKSLSNFCYTVDSIRGIFTALLNGEDGEIYNVCNDNETRSIAEIANTVANDIAHGKIKVLFDVADGACYGYAPDVLLRLSSKKLNQLGWYAETDLTTAYKRLIKYIKEE